LRLLKGPFVDFFSQSQVFYSEAPASNIVPLPEQSGRRRQREQPVDPPHRRIIDGWTWVQPWIEARYRGETMRKYLANWDKMLAFFYHRRISTPAKLTRGHCYEYVSWRTALGVSRNTAKTELRFLSVLCEELITRHVIRENPARSLGIKKLSTTLKPEISPELEAEIRNMIEIGTKFPERTHRDFFRISFELGIRHGVRIAETRLPLSDVDLDAKTISFRMKGDKVNSVPLHPALVPMFEALRAAGKKFTYDDPDSSKMASAVWSHFLLKRGFKKRYPGICFHSCRVTVASRLARAGVPMAQAMRFIAHSDTEVHKIYLRVQTGDLANCVKAL
jgi:site-specific recombinase XerD